LSKQNGSHKRFDVIVIGGGPAGSATALTLSRQGYSIAIIERSAYADTRVGETLPPAIRKLLVSLGVWDRFVAGNHSASPAIYSAWGNDDLYANDLIFNPYGSGWHVDRTQFDKMLALTAEEAGVTVLRETELVSLSTRSGEWEITVASGERRRRFSAAFLVDASGRRASVARKNGARRISYDHLIGLVDFLSPESAEPLDDSYTLVESQAEGWWYSARLPDRRLVVAFMTDSDLCARDHSRSNFWLRQLQKAPNTFSRTKNHLHRCAHSTLSANSSRLDLISGERWLAVGDAAAAYDPLSSQGVYKALESGLRAARAIEDHFTGSHRLQDYANAIQREFDDYLAIRDKHYSAERRWPNSIFWQRRQPNRLAPATLRSA
jgi:flavin-dependent dehydrogenase